MNGEAKVTPQSPGQLTIAEMKSESGYDETDESGPVEALVDYKNALEQRLVSMIDEPPAVGVERKGL